MFRLLALIRSLMTTIAIWTTLKEPSRILTSWIQKGRRAGRSIHSIKKTPSATSLPTQCWASRRLVPTIVEQSTSIHKTDTVSRSLKTSIALLPRSRRALERTTLLVWGRVNLSLAVSDDRCPRYQKSKQTHLRHSQDVHRQTRQSRRTSQSSSHNRRRFWSRNLCKGGGALITHQHAVLVCSVSLAWRKLTLTMIWGVMVHWNWIRVAFTSRSAWLPIALPSLSQIRALSERVVPSPLCKNWILIT